MKTKLLISKKTYNLGQMAPITKWIECDYDISYIRIPENFDERVVNANLQNISLESEFKELQILWQEKDNIRNQARKMVSDMDGLTDIVLFLGICAIVVETINESKCKIIAVSSIDELKKELA